MEDGPWDQYSMLTALLLPRGASGQTRELSRVAGEQYEMLPRGETRFRLDRGGRESRQTNAREKKRVSVFVAGLLFFGEPVLGGRSFFGPGCAALV